MSYPLVRDLAAEGDPGAADLRGGWFMLKVRHAPKRAAGHAVRCARSATRV